MINIPIETIYETLKEEEEEIYNAISLNQVPDTC